MPLELEIPSLRVSLRGIVDDDSYREQRLQQLEMLDEWRINSLKHIQEYHKTLEQSYNDKVIQHSFSVGDLVLYENQHNMNALLEEKEKFSPNWLGPYIVVKVYGSNTYKIANLEGMPLKEPINDMHLRRYFS
ncbi:hypothetical protein SUGI_0988310 [Cryptomeria japonica]|nr:hypothetical protein SUGI_0988310 [Cryptomeria japonica]